MCSWFYCPENVFIIKIPAVFRKAPESWNADQGLCKRETWSGLDQAREMVLEISDCDAMVTQQISHFVYIHHHFNTGVLICISAFSWFLQSAHVGKIVWNLTAVNALFCLCVCVCVYIHIVTQIGCLKQQQSEWRRKVQKSNPNRIHSLKILQNMEFSHEKITAF